MFIIIFILIVFVLFYILFLYTSFISLILFVQLKGITFTPILFQSDYLTNADDDTGVRNKTVLQSILSGSLESLFRPNTVCRSTVIIIDYYFSQSRN